MENRCLTIRVSESSEQTAAIHSRQRTGYTRSGPQLQKRRDRITKLHQNAQRLLKPPPVVIPWADKLRFQTDHTRMRRDHAKYLSLIATITLLHQYQRPIRVETIDGNSTEYLESTLADIEPANKIARDVMGKSLDHLLPQTRRLLVLIDNYVNSQSRQDQTTRTHVRFTQRRLRESLGCGDFQLRRHLSRLVELEYVIVHRTGHGNSREYELLYNGEGRDGTSFLLGLTEASELIEHPASV